MIEQAYTICTDPARGTDTTTVPINRPGTPQDKTEGPGRGGAVSAVEVRDVSLYDVEDFESYATPVLILKTDGETSDHLVELSTSDAHFLHEKSNNLHKENSKVHSDGASNNDATSTSPHIFQSDPKRLNALYADHESAEAGAGLRILRRLLHRVVETYLNSTLDCMHVDGSVMSRIDRERLRARSQSSKCTHTRTHTHIWFPSTFYFLALRHRVTARCPTELFFNSPEVTPTRLGPSYP